MTSILGIDFGTTKSCMAVMRGGRPVIIENSEGSRITPSVVAFTKDGKWLVGEAARRQAVTNPTNTISSVKRFMGRKFDEVQNELQRVPYRVVKAANGDAHIRVDCDGVTRTFSPPEISAMIFAKLKSDAEQRLDEKIKHAVITVPAHFNLLQHDAVITAGKLAGFEDLLTMSETTAAAMAYGLKLERDEVIAVYDLGGGNFSASVLEIGDGVFEVKALNGDTHLGGDDWDNALMNWILTDFESDTGVNLTRQPEAIQRIIEEAEKAKIALSSSQEYELNLPFITATQAGPKHIHITLTRSQLEQLTDKLFERTVASMRNCLKDAGLAEKKIEQLVLVGGMTRMPKVIDTARKLIGREPHKGVNAEEVVAIGAAIRAGIRMGEVKDVLPLDVIPFTLAIETAGGVATPMIPRNTTFPARKSQIFSTQRDNQTCFDVKVLQGERALSRDNVFVGRLSLDGIPQAPLGTPQIEVMFDVDPNGVLLISAKDLGTGREQRLTVPDRSARAGGEIRKPNREAECPHCGETQSVDAGTGTYKCPDCGKDFEIRLSCPGCGEELHVEEWGEMKCPDCGAAVESWEEAKLRKPKLSAKPGRRHRGRRILGKYSLENCLGEGAFGETWKAVDLVTGQTVAVKIFKSADYAFEQLRREVEVLRSVEHSNLVRYLDCNIIDTTWYLTMDFCDGGSLTDQIGATDVPTAVRYIHQILKGVEFLHQRNLVHRDIKPDNIFLHQGRIKVGDLGIAIESNATLVGAPVGTLTYMAPEQLLRGRTSRRSDIWSIGVVAFELLHGRRLFTDPEEIAEGSDVRISLANRDLAAVLTKALQRDEKQRFQTCGEFSAALAKVV